MAHSNPWDEPLLSGHHSDDENLDDDDNGNRDDHPHVFVALPQPSSTAPAPSSSSPPPPPEGVIHPSFSQTTTVPSSTSSKKGAAPYEHEHVLDMPPPSYETVIIKDDLSQLRDIKDKKLSESRSASYFQFGEGSSSASSKCGPSVARVAPPNDLGLTGQIALGSANDHDDGENARDVDRLLGPDGVATIASHTNAESESDDDDDDANSYWTVVGDDRAWGSLCYMLFGLLPWTLFCYCWTLTIFISASVLLIFPPLGYPFMVLSVTSWRALARVDLELSAALVSNTVRQRYPFIPAEIYIPCEPGPAWRPPRFFGYELPLPDFVNRRLQSRHASRSRRPKNMWYRGTKHLKATMGDRHSIKSLFYFLVWKMMFAIPVAIVVLIMFSVTMPFMICLLPTLLAMSRAFANWQYRWAVNWLSEKPAPNIV